MAKRKVRAPISGSRTRSGVGFSCYSKQEVVSESSSPISLRRKRAGSPLPLPTSHNKRQRLEPGADRTVVQRKDKPHNTVPASNSSSITAAAKREEELRADLRADVRGPYLVTCRICGRDVKLSNKSVYVGSHWRTHAKRCEKSHNTNSARESESNPDDHSIIKERRADGPGSDQSSRVQVILGASPLKLKFVFSKSQKASAPLETNRGYAGSQRASPEPSISNTEAPRGSPEYERTSLLTFPSSQVTNESNDGDDSVMTPEPEDVPAVFVVLPSFDSALDEIQEETEMSEMMEVDAKWTDGEYTTSPLDISFPPTTTRDADVAGEGDLGPGNMDPEVISFVQEDHTHLTATPKLQKTASGNASPSQDITITSAAHISECNSSISTRSAVAAHSPQEIEPENDDSDLEFEYPDWEPPVSPDTFERKLRARGICLENIIRNWNVTSNNKDTGNRPDASIHNARPMVTV